MPQPLSAKVRRIIKGKVVVRNSEFEVDGHIYKATKLLSAANGFVHWIVGKFVRHLGDKLTPVGCLVMEQKVIVEFLKRWRVIRKKVATILKKTRSAVLAQTPEARLVKHIVGTHQSDPPRNKLPENVIALDFQTGLLIANC